jgi:hypothetical protein
MPFGRWRRGLRCVSGDRVLGPLGASRHALVAPARLLEYIHTLNDESSLKYLSD